MKLLHRLHARSMLRGHAAFWRHAQTVALATILSETKRAIAYLHVMREGMHISFLLCRPTGPAYRPSLFIFFDFHVFRI